MLSHRMATGILDIANGKFFRGLWKIITKEKVFKLLKPVLKDPVEFVKQGAAIAMGLLLLQTNEKENPEIMIIYGEGEINDYENMYFSQKELAKLYSRFDETSSIGYYKQALDSAKKLKDTFKEALVHFEMGEFFYDRLEDEKALVNFLNSNDILKNTKPRKVSYLLTFMTL